jgi:LysR family glycine cleavage system transcriptional activator
MEEIDSPSPIVVCVPHLAWTWLAGQIHEVLQKVPKVQFRTIQNKTLPEDVEFDVALLPFSAVPRDGYDEEILFYERLIPACARPYQKSHRMDTPQQVARLPLLITDRDAWRSWFADAGLVSEQVVAGPEMSVDHLAWQAALSGQGVALLCTFAAVNAKNSGQLVLPFDISVPTGRRFSVVWRRESQNLEALLFISNWIRENVARLAGRHTPLLFDPAG